MTIYAITANNRDGFSEENQIYTSAADGSYSTSFFGYDTFTVDGPIDAAFIFDTEGGPGDTVDVCQLTLRQRGNGGDINYNFLPVTVQIYCFDVDQVALFVDGGGSRISDWATRTGASVTWTISGTGINDQGTRISPDFSAIAQAVVNRPGFSGRLGVALRYQGASTDTYMSFYDYGTNAGLAATLDFQWTPAGGGSAIEISGTSAGRTQATVSPAVSRSVSAVAAGRTQTTASTASTTAYSLTSTTTGRTRASASATVARSISSGQAPTTAGYALQFTGQPEPTNDRVRIPVDVPAGQNPPIDISSEFTIEFWAKGNVADNQATVAAVQSQGWIRGNTIVDRDIWGSVNQAFGISFAEGRVCWGATADITTAIGATNVLDGEWHLIGCQWDDGAGLLEIYVDHLFDGSVSTSYTGSLAYPDGYRSGDPSANDEPYLVLGNEKHQAGVDYPSFAGFMTELRISNTLRYPAGGSRPTAPFPDDSNTMGLYHFDEGAGGVLGDTATVVGAPTDGEIIFGGSPVAPIWVVSDAPIHQAGSYKPGQQGTTSQAILSHARALTSQATGQTATAGAASRIVAIPLQAQTAGRTGASASLTVTRSLVVDQTGQTTEQVTATVSRSMSSTAAGATEAAAVISTTTVTALQAQAAGRTVTSGSLTVTRSLVVNQTGQTTEQVTATVSRSITAQAAGSSEAAGIISTAAVTALQAQTAGRTGASASLIVTRSLVVDQTGQTTEQVTATVSRSMSSAAAGSSKAAGIISTAAVTALQAQAVGRTVTSGSLTVSRSLVVNQTGQTTEQVTATVSRSITAQAAGETEATGAVTTANQIVITGQAAGRTVTTCTLTVVRSLVISPTGRTTEQVTATVSRSMNSTAAGEVIEQHTLTVSRSIITQAAGATRPANTLSWSGIRASAAGATQTTALTTVQRSITATAPGGLNIFTTAAILRRLTATCRGGSLVVAILTASIFEIDMVAERTYIIPAESRKYYVPAENRTYLVEADD